MKTKTYQINITEPIDFQNHVDYCVGTGRMGLALQKAYQDQLELVQNEIGFAHIRGHGLFSDDMAIYQEYQDENGITQTEYNFTYLDMVMDAYQRLHIRPFLELGFMPHKMGSGDQTVFYWKGNVTPPREYALWKDMVQATLRHLMERYGAEEVVSWPVEVWNEPNLSGFWKDADMEAYFRLFKETFWAVKEVDKRFKVGGPAICGVDDVRWLKKFLEFCEGEKIPLDIVTRHHYMFGQPDHCGHYTYAKLRVPKETMQELYVSREIIDSFELYRGLPMHITEYNTSYSPDSPVHDTIQNAAYIAWLLSRMGEVCESYSYWTFGDIFEEKGVPFTPFHGGFGLVANGEIPKPTFWTFRFFKDLQGTCIERTDEMILMKGTDGGYFGTAWNLCLDREEELQLEISLPVEKNETYCLLTKCVDEDHGNPLKIWHELGEPANPSKEDVKILRESAVPWIRTQQLLADASELTIRLNLSANAVLWFELRKVKKQTDRGYDYERTVKIG